MFRLAIRVSVVTGLVTILTFGVTNSGPTIKAQGEATAIKYGQTVRDRITDKAFEIWYGFEGKQKEVLVVRMNADGTNDGLKTPAFVVFGGTRKIIESTRIFTLSQTVAYAVFQLPTDDLYTIVATRRGGKAGKDVGRFTLSLSKAAPLEADKPIHDETNDKTEKYYALELSSPFTVSYRRTGGKFRPAIYISAIKAAGATEPVGELSGRFLDGGTITIAPASATVYIVRIGQAFFSNSTGDVQYMLSFSAQSE